ncbi:MAG TPA: CpaF family protein [Actinomycetota bacterium]|nr:CpaF family protein [Actinomycetota bacterium]
MSGADARRLRAAVRARLLPRAAELEGLSGPERRLRVRDEVLSVLREERVILPARAVSEVVNQVSDEVVGLGPIERLLKDPEVSEVMVNGADDVYVERKGRVERVDDLLFEGEEQVYHLIERIVAPLGLRVDEQSPYVDARLPDGARAHAVIPPLSLCGPVVTIRKFSLRPFSPQDLVRLGTLTEGMVEFLAACVRGRANIVVSGGTSSGKTSLLGVLSSFIPAGERLITIEDAAELRLSQPHVVGLEARPPNVEGVGEVTVRALVRNALRMRPDRIIVGEVRGGEALDMLQAMNTGHHGSLSTAHANSPQDLVARLETMALMSDVALPVSHVREQIASALDLVVHMARLPDGRRVVAAVAAVEGIRGGHVVVEDVFRWRRAPVERFEATGRVPSLVAALEERGERVPRELFGPPSPPTPTRPAPPPRPPRVHPASPPSAAQRGGWPGSARRLGTILE